MLDAINCDQPCDHIFDIIFVPGYQTNDLCLHNTDTNTRKQKQSTCIGNRKVKMI